ncbi:MAG: DNA repair protein RecO [Chloroflexota bacterium]|nr:DNA repair protein RecO [Chloroflexota bacterium]
MRATRLYRVEAVVLKRIESRGADDIVILYTANQGKLKAVARGARRSESKLGGHVETITHGDMLLSQGHGSGFPIITQARMVDGFLPLREDLWRISSAMCAAEMVDRFAPEGESNFAMFQLLVDTLSWLCKVDDSQIPLLYFQLNLAGLLGYRPQLLNCVCCEGTLQPISIFFSSSAGGVLCPSCCNREIGTCSLSVDALKVLRFFQNNNLPSACRLRISAELRSELQQLLQGYIRYVLEQEVRSLRWMDRLRNESCAAL